jgi:hypothetical protein
VRCCEFRGFSSTRIAERPTGCRRCLLKKQVRQAPTEQNIAGVMWKRPSASPESPACLALDGPNPDAKGEEEKFVPRGYMTLEFNEAGASGSRCRGEVHPLGQTR